MTITLATYARYIAVLQQRASESLSLRAWTATATPRYEDHRIVRRPHNNNNNNNNASAADGGDDDAAADAWPLFLLSTLKPFERVYANVNTLFLTPMTQVSPRIYVGSAFDAADEDQLDAHGITHIVNATRGIQCFFRDNEVQYLRVPVGDTGDDRIAIHLYDQVAQWMLAALRNPRAKLLVHCMMGRSRSVALVCYFLWIQQRMPVAQAYAQVSAARSCVDMNMNFYKDLVSAQRVRDDDDPSPR